MYGKYLLRLVETNYISILSYKSCRFVGRVLRLWSEKHNSWS